MNQQEQKEEVIAKKSHISWPVARERKAAYVRAARPGPLLGWLEAVADKAAGYQPPPDK